MANPRVGAIKKENGPKDEDEPVPRMLAVLTHEGKHCGDLPLPWGLLSTYWRTRHEREGSLTEFRLPAGVPDAAVANVILYLQHHAGVSPGVVPKPLRSKEMSQVCADPWDATFIDAVGVPGHMEKLYDLMLAARALDITCLLHLCCAKVASCMKGEPLHRLKDILSCSPEQHPSEVEPRSSPVAGLAVGVAAVEAAARGTD